MQNLKKTYGADFKVTMDESAMVDDQSTADRLWLQQIAGKKGHVFVQSRKTLGAYVKTSHDSTDRLGRLLKIRGTRLLARGDHEASVEFPPGAIEKVAEILQLKRRRKVSEEQRAVMAARLKAVRPVAA